MNSLKNKNLLLINFLQEINLKVFSKKELNFFKKKKILITGVSGIIGINLLFFFNELNKKKFSVYIDGTYNKSIFPFVKNLFKDDKKVNFIKINLAKKRINYKKKYDLIFHCAGYGQPAKFLKFAHDTYKLNSLAIMNLKSNLSSNGKFIYMSSTEIYSGNNKLCNENSVGFTSTSHLRSPYIESKRFGESFIMNSNINYLIYRVCLIFGPGGKINDERIINLLLQRSILNKNIDLYGSLKQSRSNLYITDAVNLIIKSLVRYNKEIFNLNNNQMTTIKKISQIISKISNKKIKKHKNLIKGSPKIIKISNKKILKYTNYKIFTNLKDGLFKTYKWYYNLINN